MKNANGRLVPADEAPATIGFRLDVEARNALKDRAKGSGVSIHELARSYVMEVLQERDERAALRAAILMLNDEITLLRANLGLAVEALLMSAGKVDAPDARAWVEKHFPRKERC